MSKNQVIIALVVLCLLGTIWGSVKDKKATGLERQLAAMKEQATAPAAPAADGVEGHAPQAASGETSSAIADLKAQNKELLEQAATLKGSLASQKDEIANLKIELEAASNEQALEAMQAELDKRTAEVAKLEETVVAAKAELYKKNVALAAAEEAVAGFEELKSTLANNVDTYSAKSQELSAEVDEYRLQVSELEKALEERTKLLVESGEELARTKLNMNILLSKIAAQNNSLSILEETRVALEKELAAKVQAVEELQHQLSAQVIVDEVTVEEVVPAAEAQEVKEEVAPAN